MIEVDSRRYHSSGWQRRRDAHRDELLREHGFRHARVDEDTIEHDPAQAVATARALIDARPPRRVSG